MAYYISSQLDLFPSSRSLTNKSSSQMSPEARGDSACYTAKV